MKYQDFQLSAKQLEIISNELAKIKTRQYIKQNNVEPSEEIESGFYEITPEQKEMFRRAFFSNQFIDESDVNIKQPEIIENTDEQNEVEDRLIDELLNGQKTVSAESINNITIPSEVNVAPNITGKFEDGATIQNNSSKYMTINNTSEEPIDINIIANNTVYLTGKFNNIYFNGKTLNGTSGNYPIINGELDIVTTLSGSVSISASFQENSTVKYLGSHPMTVANYNNENANVNIYAPNSTVTVNGKYNEVEATVSDETLVLRYSFHTNKLKVNKGKVIYQGTDENDFYNELIGEGVEVEPYGYDIVGTNVANTKDTPGVYTFAEDFANNKPVVFGTFATGKYKYDLNGHNVAFGDSARGCFLVRGSAIVDFVDTIGNGELKNNADSYAIWAAANDVVVNIYGGTFEAYTHVLYAEKGSINVYGGTFNCLSEDKRYTLNCYDASYTAGTAKITVYGGKFYNFNPAESYSEPGGQVSFVANGYKVVTYQEGNDTIYEVVSEN